MAEPTHRIRPVVVLNPRFGGALLDWLRAVLFVGWAACSVGAVVGIATYAHFARDLPELPDFNTLIFEGITTYYADDGQVLGEQFSERRLMLPYERIPRTLILALIATEDSRFFSHSGVDLRGIGRAALRNLKAGGVKEGGSTITQQLAKSFVGSQRSLERKVREMVVARRLEDIYDKEQILLLYLNRIFFGHHSHGVQAAAQNYFRKNVWNLTLAEMALLAGLPQAPSRLNPLVNPDGALERRAWVLDRMVDAGFVAEDAAETAKSEPLRVYPLIDEFGDKAPAFVTAARRALLHKLGPDWAQRPLRVHTTANVEQSLKAEAALQDGLHAADRRQGYRGPLGRVEDPEQWSAILKRNAAARRGEEWQLGELVAAIVTEVREDGMRVAIEPDRAGWVSLSRMDWAGEYSEFPIDERTGKRLDRGPVSFEPKLKDPRTRFSKGDVVLVRFVEASSSREARLAKLARPLSDGLPVALEQLPQVEGAFLARDLHTGAITALIGAYDFDRSEFDRTIAPRQTGSTMKPIFYALAYDLGFPPSRLVSGAPVDINGYKPGGDRMAPDATAWDGLVASENAISVRVHQWALQEAGLERYRAWGKALGLSRNLEGYPSEVLGTDQSLWDMVGVYAILGSRGRSEPARLVRKVEDAEGRVIYEDLHVADPANDTLDVLRALAKAAKERAPQAIDERTAYTVASNLTDVVKRGTARRASKLLPFQAGGKTGTLPYDVWFIGFSERYVAGAWVGADKRERVLGQSVKRNRVSGADTALPIWTEWMVAAHRGAAPGLMPGALPPGLEILPIDPATGLLAATGGHPMVHRVGTGPTHTSAGAANDGPDWTGSEEFDF